MATAKQCKFETSGFRGLTGEGVTPELAYRIGLAYGVMLKTARQGRECWALVAHDTRYGADVLAEEVTSGLRFAGVSVHMAGCLSTGEYAAHMQRSTRYDGGIMVTGSHMAPNRVGIIPMLDNGHYADRDITDQIAALVNSDEPIPTVPFNEIGKREQLGNPQADYDRHVASAKQRIARLLKQQSAQKIMVVDPGNGTTCGVVWSMFGKLGNLRVYACNKEPKPIPDRPSECNPENCDGAVRQTKEASRIGVYFGVCFDCDGDRAGFIDETGRMLRDDEVAGIFAKHLLKAGDVVVCAVNSSALIEELAAAVGASVKYCRIGQPPSNTLARAVNPKFVFEANSGKFGFPEFSHCFDGPYAALRMLEIMLTRGKSLSELAAELPQYSQARMSIPVPDAAKAELVRRATEKIRTTLGERIVREDFTDGTKFFIEGGRWLLLRPSGTEPLVRAYSDVRGPKVEAEGLVAFARVAFQEAETEMLLAEPALTAG